MIRDNISDTTDYKPSYRHLIETEYWSDENICRTQVNLSHNLWNTPLTTNSNNMSDQKDHTIDDTQLTPKNNKKPKSKDKGKKLNVHFDDTQNHSSTQNNSGSDQQVVQNFAPGSNSSPSLLQDGHPPRNISTTNSKSSSRQKRSQIPAPIGQNDDLSTLSPLPKRRKLSNLNSNNNNANDLSYDELQAHK